MNNWLQVVLPASPKMLDTLTAQLVARGFDTFQTEDSRDFAESSPHWDMADADLIEHYRDICRVIVYLPEDETAPAKLEVLRELAPNLTVSNKKEEDWAENWKQYYKPLPIGSRLLVQPAWLPTENRENRAVFLNNPGATFGTGLHASTRLCLELLEGAPPAGRVLDLGCGSGILALCALTLGAEAAVGADIDPLAQKVASANAAANGRTAVFTAHCGNILEDTALQSAVGDGYALCFSNIIADVILPLCPIVPRFLQPGGRWIVSGILDERADEIAAAARTHGFALDVARSAEGWTAMQLTVDSWGRGTFLFAKERSKENT